MLRDGSGQGRILVSDKEKMAERTVRWKGRREAWLGAGRQSGYAEDGTILQRA